MYTAPLDGKPFSKEETGGIAQTCDTGGELSPDSDMDMTRDVIFSDMME